MTIAIRPVTEPDDLMAVYRQRYAIYVEEMRYPQRCADHAARTVIEPLDDTAHILGAFDDGVLVGSIRHSFGRDSDFGEYVDFYGMERFGRYFPARMNIVTKLMMAPGYRKHGVTLELLIASHRYAHAHFPETAFALMDSKPPVDEYFQHLGWRRLGPQIVHPAAGLVTPMVLVLSDVEHLSRIGSPFANLPVSVDGESVRWFHATFAGELGAPSVSRRGAA